MHLPFESLNPAGSVSLRQFTQRFQWRARRTILPAAASIGANFDLLNRFAGPFGVFKSFEDAWRAARSTRLQGHEDQALSEAHLSLPFRQSDYPMLYWLSHLREKHLLDFGGSVGNLYYLYRDYLDKSPVNDWTVYDVAEVVERGKALATARGANNLHFISDLEAASAPDILLSSGSLHYWESSIANLLATLGHSPKHVFVNRTPLTRRNPYVVLQKSQSAAFPCMVRNREAFQIEWEQAGYELIDEWLEPQSILSVPLFPKYTVSGFSGFYFRQRAAA